MVRPDKASYLRVLVFLFSALFTATPELRAQEISAVGTWQLEDRKSPINELSFKPRGAGFEVTIKSLKGMSHADRENTVLISGLKRSGTRYVDGIYHGLDGRRYSVVLILSTNNRTIRVAGADKSSDFPGFTWRRRDIFSTIFAASDTARTRPTVAAATISQPATGDTVSVQLASARADNADEECRAAQKAAGVISSAPCVDLSTVFKNLNSGIYHFNAPDKAQLQSALPIKLVLQTALSQSLDSIFATLTGPVRAAPGRYAQSMEATLKSDDFKITPSGPQVRTATSIQPVEWMWIVTPLTGGKKTLTIEVTANLVVDKEKHNVQVRTLSQDITIEVSTMQMIAGYFATTETVLGKVVALIGSLTTVAAVILNPKWRTTVASTAAAIFRRRKQRESVVSAGPDRD